MNQRVTGVKEKQKCSVKAMLTQKNLIFQSLVGRDGEEEEEISSNLDKANKGEWK